MFNKINEEKSSDSYLSLYEYFYFDDFIKILVNGSFDVESIRIYDDSDVGLKTYGGKFTLEQFDYLLQNNKLPYISDMTIYFKDGIKINFDGLRNKVYVWTNKPNFDMNQYVEEKKSSSVRL